jgi:hypothetical protein
MALQIMQVVIKYISSLATEGKEKAFQFAERLLGM